MARPVDSMALSSQQQFLCYEMKLLIGFSTLHSAMMVDKAFCKSTDGGCWQTYYRQERQIRIQIIYLIQWGQISAPWRTEEAQCNQLAGWPPGNGAILKPCVSLCCWQMKQSAAWARPALDREASKTSTAEEVTLKFSSRGRLVSSEARLLLPLVIGSEWLAV